MHIISGNKMTLFKSVKININFRFLLWLLFLGLGSTVSAYELEIINLNHRPAQEIIPILKPLLEKDASISGEKYVLFIRASDETLQQIMSVLPTLDVELRVLRISIMQESAQMMKRYGFRIEPSKQKSNNKSNLMIYSTKHSYNNPKQQVILVTEGQWASLKTGVTVPSITRSTNPDGTVTESIQYQTVYTRLKIQPVIRGKKITVKIQSYTGNKQNMNSGQGIKTQINGNLGEWIALGGIVSNSKNSSKGFVFSTQRSSNSKQQIFIKIELTKYQD